MKLVKLIPSKAAIKPRGTFLVADPYVSELGWQAYVRRLDRRYKNVAVAHPEMSCCPPGCEDRRAFGLETGINAVSRARIVVGGSSASMHLGSLCAKPIVVWIGNGADIERYLSYWNPFGSPVFPVTDQTFRSRPKQLVATLERAVQHLGIRGSGHP